MNKGIKSETKRESQLGKESISPDTFFDLQEIEMALLREKKQAQDYNRYCRLSIAGFYLSLLLFVWHVIK
jgi:hypothetical protein